ncbi:MAG: DinB family protein [Phycisphaeraceae bacterium]|nr:DinB family protein [Phycisphaerales bacterium]QOJ17159.1 MAG: DinB family protein [Phycisphaeraceae bacterium]
MPATVSQIADIMIASGSRALGYGELLLKDIPADRFAHMPLPNMNHAAFNYGHLSIYPNRLLSMIGRDDLVVEKPGFTDLFKAGSPCVEQDGRYPAKDVIASYYVDRYQALLKALEGVAEETFARPNPAEGRMRELFPTVGKAVNFLLGAHHMMHLGQVSAWRRAIGLGSAM